MSSFAREGTASRGGGSSRRDPAAGPARPGAAGGRTDRDPAPGRPPPSRPARPPTRPTPLLRRSCSSGPRSPPPRLPERWPGRPGRQSPRGLEHGAHTVGERRGASMLPARAGAPRAPRPPARTVRAAGRRPLTFGAADLPTPSGGNESCHGFSPRAPLACPACEAPPRSREGGCAPARVRPVALSSSSSSFHYIIFSFSEGWVGVGSLERGKTFATFLHSFSSTTTPPPPVSLEKTMLKGVKNLGR